MPPRRPLLIVALCVAAIGSTPVRADDDTVKSATFLLRSAIHGNGETAQHQLLLALRQLRDPALAPVFRALMEDDSPTLKIHGFLGLAELDPKQRLSLKELAQIKDPQMAGWIVSAHLETDMLDAEQAAEIVSWPDLDPSVK